MNTNDAMSSALGEVDERRRGFLGKLLVGGATVVALPAMSTVVLGQDGQKGAGKGKGGKGKGDGGGKGKGGMRDPAKMAAMLIKNFDKDGDKALNQKELAAALTEMAKQRGGGKGKGGAGGKGKGKGTS
jgi:hypothetical protein